MREKVGEALTELKSYQNGMFWLGTGLKIYSKEVNRVRCMRGSDGKLCFNKK